MYFKDNKKFPYTELTNKVRISVITEFLEEQSDTDNNLWVWAYHIMIENNRQTAVQLLERYWKIIDETGKIKEVEGPGVIGLQPLIEPGNYFEYSSGTPLPTSSGIMSGSYKMIDKSGKSFEAKIPKFSLDLPYNKKIIN
ncbi:MAG: Protein ApaG [Alphaproteobacteria bacterium MarineAlpha9_Bin2]|nr:MAG: Protein ApaG [Alphaproteobacteria bacterium MarineAlpha9_Bin2]PPR29940.1 MAG: Protein ApaG [Alphaproteobacteria bacterium MarineAlpha9_Bin1]